MGMSAAASRSAWRKPSAAGVRGRPRTVAAYTVEHSQHGDVRAHGPGGQRRDQGDAETGRHVPLLRGPLGDDMRDPRTEPLPQGGVEQGALGPCTAGDPVGVGAKRSSGTGPSRPAGARRGRRRPGVRRGRGGACTPRGARPGVGTTARSSRSWASRSSRAGVSPPRASRGRADGGREGRQGVWAQTASAVGASWIGWKRNRCEGFVRDSSGQLDQGPRACGSDYRRVRAVPT